MSIGDLYAHALPVLRPVLRVAPVLGGVAVVWWRVRETRVPVTGWSIVVPPLGMSAGLAMFLAPPARVPWSWAVVALLSGAVLFAWPLTRSTMLELRDGVTYVRRSRGFLLIILGLLAVRLALHDYIGHLVSPIQTAALFYLLAFGMIVRWRATMLLAYRRITRS